MRNLIKTICFLVIFFTGFVVLGDMVQPKRKVEIAVDNYHDERSGFYELPENTLDVLYVGSSHVFSSISPEDIFMEYGITGYVQASSSQKIWQSYYYIEESFQTQKPKVVVFDTFMALDGESQSEAFNREAIDRMKLSPAKIHAMKTAVENNPDEEDFMSYLFLLLRYHDRWEELSREDYLWFITEAEAPAKGFLARIGTAPASFNLKSYESLPINPPQINKVCLDYLDKMKKICEKHGSKLVLTKFPTCLWNGEASAAIRKWADENEIPFLDYNAEKQLRKEADIQWEEDSLDGGNHLNYDGAMKITKAFGAYLNREFSFKDKRKDDSYLQWQRDFDYYKRCVENYELAHMTDLSEYLNKLKNEDYVVLISCRKADVATDSKAKKQLLEFGLTKKFLNPSLDKDNLFVMEHGETVFSKITRKQVFFDENISGFDISTSGKKENFKCIVDRRNVTRKEDGIRFVVLDPVTGSVTDSSYTVRNEEQKLVLTR